MDDRKGSLQRLFEASGSADRLTPDQAREILDHLEDSVEAKCREGLPELEAAARAFEEIGDLRALSRELQRPNSVLATLPDWLSQPSRRSHLAMAGCLLMSGSIVFVTQDALMEFYRSTHLTVPAVTLGLARAQQWVQSYGLLALPLALVVVYVILFGALTRPGRYLLLGALIGNGAVFSASLIGLIGALLGLWA
jgi:hypothetical protein